MSGILRLCLIALMTAAAPVLYVAAQQAALPAFRAGVDVLQLDVLVLDHRRAPVPDLARDDFTAEIDDQAVRIVAFTPVRLRGALSPLQPGPREAGADVVVNDGSSEGRLIVFHFDQNVLPWEMLTGRAIVREAIAALGPADLAAITYLGQARPQNFTADHSLLFSTLEQPFIDDADNPGRCLCGVCQVEAVAHIAESLRNVGDRPKVLFYIGKGMPFQGLPSRLYDCSGPLKLARERLFRALDSSGLVVHEVDPTGLIGVGRLAPSRVARAGPTFPVGGLSSPGLLPDRTGGRWVRSTNDPQLFSRPILAESESYYVLGVERPEPRPDGRDRSVRVRVRRRNLTVVSRRAIAAGRPLGEPSERTRPVAGEAPASLVAALAGVTPLADLRMAVTTAAFRASDPTEGATVLVVTSVRPTPAVTSASAPERSLRVLTGSWDRNGTPVVTHTQTVSPGAGVGPFEVASSLSLRQGRHEIRVAADELSSTARGSVYTHVDVPDFAKDRLSLSGLLVGAAPAPTLASTDLFKDLLPIIPTALRDFTKTSRVAAFVRAYQGSNDAPRDVTMTATLIGVGETLTHRETTTLAAGRFATTRSADYLIDVPVAQLVPGPYLLTLEAALDDKRVARHMRFEMR
jgi:VWFA-related protein